MPSLKTLLNKLEKWHVIFLVSALFTLIVCLPIADKFYHNSITTTSTWKIIVELVAIFLIQYLVLFLIFLLPWVRFPIYFLHLLSSFLVFYLFTSFGKNIDAWVVGDIIGNIDTLTLEYLSLRLVIYASIFVTVFLFFGYLITKAKRNSWKSRSFIIVNTLVIILVAAVVIFNNFTFRRITKNYPSINVIDSIIKFSKLKKGFDFEMANAQERRDALAKHDLFHSEQDQEVVFIIGESVRSDYFYSLLKKYGGQLAKEKNIAYFHDVKACETLTRTSLPCMLTDVSHEHWNQFVHSVNLIDVFNKLGFSTYWIDNQSLHGYFDVTYSFLAKSSDLVMDRKYITIDSGSYYDYDDVLLKYIRSSLAQTNQDKPSGNKFMIIHLLGSHWHQEARYPDKFRIFKPTCALSKSVGECDRNEVINSYNNSLIYGYDVLSKIIDTFRDRKAIIFYSPDHGFSLGEVSSGEGGFFGNGGDKTMKAQIMVPMFVWYSDSYKKSYPKMVERIKASALNDGHTHEYLFHSILGCSSIKSDLIKDKFNICEVN